MARIKLHGKSAPVSKAIWVSSVDRGYYEVHVSNALEMREWASLHRTCYVKYKIAQAVANGVRATILAELARKNAPKVPDARYTVAPEFTGDVWPRYVARFCGERIGDAKTKHAAIVMCQQAYKARMKRAGVEV